MNDVFTDHQPQYPDLQAHFDIDSKGVQAVFITAHHIPALTRHMPAAYSVIEEIVESFIEGFPNEMERVATHPGSPLIRLSKY